MTTWLLWECLTPEAQRKLRALMPLDWEPPTSNHRRIKLDCQIEDLEEIADYAISPWLVKDTANKAVRKAKEISDEKHS